MNQEKTKEKLKEVDELTEKIVQLIESQSMTLALLDKRVKTVEEALGPMLMDKKNTIGNGPYIVKGK